MRSCPLYASLATRGVQGGTAENPVVIKNLAKSTFLLVEPGIFGVFLGFWGFLGFFRIILGFFEKFL